jgi:hypothetical protein
MSTTVCPCCRQPIAEARAGVRLPARKLRIFDCIHRAGPGGIPIETVNSIVYGDDPATRSTIRNHIKQINDLFETADVRLRIIGSKPRGIYRTVGARNAV